MVTIFRKIVLSVAGNRLVKGFVNKYGMKLGVRRFVAAESFRDSIYKVRDLNYRGFAVTLDYLGESVLNQSLAEESARVILQTLDDIHRHRLDSHISVKLTQLGLLIDENFCLNNLDQIVERAKQYKTFVRIDMEDSSVTEQTLRIFHTLLDRYGKEHVGIVIQSYLYRSEKDMELLGQKNANVRVVKGAYSEPRDVAFPDKKDVDRQFVDLAQKHMLSGCYTAIATHDRRIVDHLKTFQQTNNISRSRFEFQMLYGIAEDLQLQLRNEGYRVRIYTPFGKHWYSYFSRRIAERPANLFFVLKAIFSKFKAVILRD
jgi:proline dehydrogenase